MTKKLIVLEGIDGSGKATQAKLLCQSLKERGEEVCKISFPDYQSESSVLVKMYLEGRFGKEADAVNPYVASTFFTVDRYASYELNWKTDYLSSKFIIADRYTTSNIVHQMGKLEKSSWQGFIDWLDDLEYGKFALPKPDLVIYLDVDPQISHGLLEKRYGAKPNYDLHEKDLRYLNNCREAAQYAAEKLNWKVLRCFESGAMKDPQEIRKDLLFAVLNWRKEREG